MTHATQAPQHLVAPVFGCSGAPALRRSGAPALRHSSHELVSAGLLQCSASSALDFPGAQTLWCLAGRLLDCPGAVIPSVGSSNRLGARPCSSNPFRARHVWPPACSERSADRPLWRSGAQLLLHPIFSNEQLLWRSSAFALGRSDTLHDQSAWDSTLALSPGALRQSAAAALSHGVQSPVVLGALRRSVTVALNRFCCPTTRSESRHRSAPLFFGLACPAFAASVLRHSRHSGLILVLWRSVRQPLQGSAVPLLGCSRAMLSVLGLGLLRSSASPALGPS